MSFVAITSLAIALSIAAFSQASRAMQLPDNPRDLASLSVQWRFTEPVGGVLLKKDAETLFIRGGGRLTAVALASGAVRWRIQLTDATDTQYGDQGPVALDDAKAIAVSFGNRLFIVDAQTGRLRREITLGQHIQVVLAPPLLVLSNEDDGRSVLTRVDAESGAVIARRELGKMVYDTRLEGDVVLSVREPPDGTSKVKLEHIVEATRIADLSEAWSARFISGSDFEVIDGRVCLDIFEGGSDDSKTRPIDPLSGRLGPPLPERRHSDVSGGFSWELELVGLEMGKERAAVRRNSLRTGSPIWTTTLPGDPDDGWLIDVDGSKVYVHCDHDGGHGYLLVLDWSDGRLLQAAYGFRRLRGLLSHDGGDSLLAWSNDGVTSFSSTIFGPSARNSEGLEEEVESILDELTCDRSVGFGVAASADLKTLGAAALPLIAEKIPRLSEPALAVTANVLADAGYRPSAAALAARLRAPNPVSNCALDWGMETNGATIAVLRAVGRLGGDAEVDAVAAILEDAERDSNTRLQAFATLASLGTPSALRIIESVLPRGRGSRTPRNEHARVAAAILDQFFHFAPNQSPPDAKGLKISVLPGLPKDSADMMPDVRPLTRDERRYTLEMTGDDMCGAGYEIIVGEMTGTWVIKEWRLIWIS